MCGQRARAAHNDAAPPCDELAMMRVSSDAHLFRTKNVCGLLCICSVRHHADIWFWYYVLFRGDIS